MGQFGVEVFTVISTVLSLAISFLALVLTYLSWKDSRSEKDEDEIKKSLEDLRDVNPTIRLYDRLDRILKSKVRDHQESWFLKKIHRVYLT